MLCLQVISPKQVVMPAAMGDQQNRSRLPAHGKTKQSLQSRFHSL